MNAFFQSNGLGIVIIVINLLLLLLYVLNNIKLSKLRKNYSDFMSKLGKGNNIDEMLKKYIEEVESISLENKEIEKYCDKLNNKADQCIRKIGLVRYNAYKDTGSNLSFTLAMLNEENTGIVLNGIYSRNTSNIYCKTVEKGTSSYALSKEEEEAISKAIQYKWCMNKKMPIWAK